MLPCCQLVALQGDLDLLNKYLQPPGCTVQQLITVFDGSIPADMVRAAMAGLELLAKDASATSEAAKSLTDPLDLLGRPLLFFVSTCASVKRTVDMPPGALHGLSVEDRRRRLQSAKQTEGAVTCIAYVVCQALEPCSTSVLQHASQHARCGLRCCSVDKLGVCA